MSISKIQKKGKSFYIINEIKPSLVRRNQYYGVNIHYDFSDVSHRSIFEEFVKRGRNIDTYLDNFNKEIMNMYQLRYYLNKDSKLKKGQKSFQKRDRLYSYISKLNYFVKTIYYNRDNKNNDLGELVITIYIKPSKTISRQIKALNTKFNNWFYRNFASTYVDPDNSKRIKVLMPSSPQFDVFELSKDDKGLKN